MMRILHVVSIMDVGGMESYIMNMYRRVDRTKIQFDFLVHHDREGVFDEEIKALGGRIYRTSVLDDLNLIKYRSDLRKLFHEHKEWRIVHGHLSSMAYWYLGEAERQGVPWRILHCHVPGFVPSLKGYVKHMLLYFSPRHANIRMACSREAGRYQFKNDDFELIPNGIEVDRFRYSEETRMAKRRELGEENTYLIGHVGRFFSEKNHIYMLKLAALLKERMPDAKLMFLGGGVLMEETQRKAAEMQVEDRILFMGMQKECAPYYQAMDVFIMPSLYEGLPLAALEAQSAGLPCLFSDTVSGETRISQDVQFLPIGDDNLNGWIDALEVLRRTPRNRAQAHAEADAYDVAKSAKRMAERYMQLWEREA